MRKQALAAAFRGRLCLAVQRVFVGWFLRGPRCFQEFVHLFNELQQLFAFAIADVEEADADVMGVVNGLGDPGEAEWQPFDAELNFNAAINSQDEALVGANAAAAQAEVLHTPRHPNAKVHEIEDGGSIDFVAGLAASIFRRCLIPRVRFDPFLLSRSRAQSISEYALTQ